MGAIIEVGYSNKKFLLKKFQNQTESTKGVNPSEGTHGFMSSTEMAKERLRSSVMRSQNFAAKQVYPITLKQGQPVGLYEMMYD